MTRIFNHVLHVLTFVKRGIVHDNDAFFRDVRQQYWFGPCGKNGRIHRTGYEAYRNSSGFYQGANGVCSPFSLQIMLSISTLAFHRIAMGSRHIMRKTAFIHIDDRLSCLLDFCYGFAKDSSFFGSCLGMIVRFFFIGNPSLILRTSDPHCTHA